MESLRQSESRIEIFWTATRRKYNSDFSLWSHSIIGLMHHPVTVGSTSSNLVGSAKFTVAYSSRGEGWTVNPLAPACVGATPSATRISDHEIKMARQLSGRAPDLRVPKSKVRILLLPPGRIVQRLAEQRVNCPGNGAEHVTKVGEVRRNGFSSEAGDCVGLPIWDCLGLRYLGSLTIAFGSKY